MIAADYTFNRIIIWYFTKKLKAGKKLVFKLDLSFSDPDWDTNCLCEGFAAGQLRGCGTKTFSECQGEPMHL